MLGARLFSITQYWQHGLLEIVVDEVNRVTPGTLNLESGRKLKCDVVLKCSGCLGDFRVDKLLQIKQMHGYWVNLDPRRTVIAEPDGVCAFTFAETAAAPAAVRWCRTALQFIMHPWDWCSLGKGG